MNKIVPIFILTLIICIATGLKAQMVTYSGPVEYHLEMIKTAGGGGTDGGYDWNVSVNERRIIDGSFFVTFTGGAAAGFSAFQLTSIEENINYINTVNNEGNDQKTSQACYDDRLVFVETATPGDSRTQRTGVSTTRVNPEKPVIEGGQMMFRGDKYTFMLMGKMKVNTSSETYTEETFPCLDTIIPPKSMSNSTTLDLPIVISGEKTIDTQDVLEGVYVKENETSNDCNKCLGGLGRMVHGDVNCSYISKITTSWTLVKRSKECNAQLSYSRGDVKINGVPAKQGEIKVGAGDVIETGQKSRMELRIGNSTYRLGSKSKLLLTNPCELFNEGKIKPNKTISTTLLKGKLYELVNKLVGNPRNFNPKTRTAVTGFRMQIWQSPETFIASANPNLSFLFFQQNDPEKAELIEGYENLPNNVSAFYIHYEDDVVKDISALKGSIKIQDSNKIKNQEITEGTMVTKWKDGTIISDVLISTK
ncbi:hypothetical protein N9164_15630 [Draconibacterium sp.]|nr:hypothetical protein [Draconibacterium sp.]